MCMAWLNLNTKTCETGNEAFTPWIANPSKVDMVMVAVISEGMAVVAMDIKAAMAINLQ